MLFRPAKGKEGEAGRSSSPVQTPISPSGSYTRDSKNDRAGQPRLEGKTKCLDCPDISRLYKAGEQYM